MELTFEKVGNQYVAEFEAPSDFNLHIEREEIGVLEVHQRGSAEGAYDFAWGTGVNGRKVIDYDFGALVYPKWIKVVSGSEVVSASVNFNVGGGSGSGESGEASTIEYLDVSGISFDEAPFTLIKLSCSSVAIRLFMNNQYVVGPYMFLNIDGDLNPSNIKAIAINPDAEVNMPESSTGGNVVKTTIKEYLVKLTGGWSDIDAIPRITKEQFYSLE